MKVRNTCLSTRICTSDIINPTFRSCKGGDLVAQLVGLDLRDVGDQSFAERFFLDF